MRQKNVLATLMQPHPDQLRTLSRWILACMVCVVLMVFVGGVTRLTESGLSIVEWKPITGILPPLSEEGWQREFAEYQTSPEFIEKNFTFGIEEFKSIFWLEYIHRLLGRITGLVFLLPLIYFTVRRVLPAPLFRRMFALSLLVAAQGTVGWIMVASGLVDQPRVAPVKLGIHLLLAFSLFALLAVTYWQVHAVPRLAGHFTAAVVARGLLILTVLQIFLGALVAGLDAGLTYNTYPLMDGAWIPPGLTPLSPWWLNHLEHIPMVQWQHRMGGMVYVISSLAAGLYLMRRLSGSERRWAQAMAAISVLQFLLGIATLLSVVEISLASAHQMLALALMLVLVRLCYALKLTRVHL